MNRQSLLPLAGVAACVLAGWLAGVAASRVIAVMRDRRARRRAWEITGFVPYGHPDRAAAPLTETEWAALEGIVEATLAAGDAGLSILDGEGGPGEQP